MYGLSPAAVAKAAVRSSGKLSMENANDCPLIIEAYDNYLSIANLDSDADFNNIEYTYASVLDSCGEQKRSKELLEKIAAAPGGYQNHAKLKLITQQLQQVSTVDEKHPLLAQLADLVSNIPSDAGENRALRDEATALYCHTLLDDANSQSAQKVLDMLNATGAGPGFVSYRARALKQLGRLEESARLMTQAIVFDSGSMAPAAAEIVSEIVDKIELWQKDANDFNQMLLDCNVLADFAHKVIDNQQTALILTETSILSGKKISITNENGIGWLRPKARLLMAQGDFNQATLVWSKIAELRRNDPAAPGQKSYNWWQAKFYELDCLAKSKAENQNITHTIDVLFNTFPEIPPPWAKKLNVLKQQCVSGPPAN
jgi:tetratricopeptide (TPR) repeat protein